MVEFLKLVLHSGGSLFKSRARLEAENLVLRHQLNLLRRKAPKRLRLTSADRLLFVWLYRFLPSTLDAITIIKPETVIRWHRCGFRWYWRWKSRPRGGRPRVAAEIRDLVRQMSLVNPLWGAPRIHGELLKLGIEVAQSTVAKYLAKGQRPPSQSWKTFLRNHTAAIASVDLFVVPTVSFKLLYGLVIIRHDRRRLVRVVSRPARPPSGSPTRSARPFHGTRRLDIWSAIATPHTVTPSADAYGRWAFVIVPPHSVPLGRTDMSSG
jgi:hypothetical protein